jgi:hypothetical protein
MHYQTQRNRIMHVTAEVRVRYAETDQMGVVYYANYLVWFEVGRVELLRALGYSYSYFSRATTKSGTQSRARLYSESGREASAWRLCSA